MRPRAGKIETTWLEVLVGHSKFVLEEVRLRAWLRSTHFGQVGV